MTQKFPATLNNGSTSEKMLSPQNDDGNDSFLSKLGASVHSKAALTTAGAVAALFATNSVASTVNFSQANYRVDEGASVATIGVKLNCQPKENPGSVSVLYTSSNGTATAGASCPLGGRSAKSDKSSATVGSSGSLGGGSAKSDKSSATAGSSGSLGGALVKSDKSTATAGSSGSLGGSLVKSNKSTATAGSSGSLGGSLVKSDKSTATVGSSGSLGVDYRAVSGTLTWGASGCGTTQTFAVPILDDSIVEDNETVHLNLNNGKKAILTIIDNDSSQRKSQRNQPGFEFSQSNYRVDEDAHVAKIDVKRFCPPGVNQSPASVSYTSSNGTATAGSSGSLGGDYTTVSGVLTWGASGNCGATKAFFVPIHHDSKVEGNETVNISLSNPSAGSHLGSTSNAVLTIIDKNSH